MAQRRTWPGYLRGAPRAPCGYAAVKVRTARPDGVASVDTPRSRLTAVTAKYPKRAPRGPPQKI
eukprot:6821771-Alexandrium_andersonii.AAC.1